MTQKFHIAAQYQTRLIILFNEKGPKLWSLIDSGKHISEFLPQTYQTIFKFNQVNENMYNSNNMYILADPPPPRGNICLH